MTPPRREPDSPNAALEAAAAAAPPPAAPAESAAAARAPVPAIVWGAAALVAALRGLPFAAILLSHPPAGQATLPIAYAPKDWLAYAALVRQGFGPFVNPFTTEPQLGRFVLLLHQALGGLHALTGVDPFWLLELSRIPLVFAFTWALWRLVVRIHADPGARRWACLLVLLSGGVAFVARWAAPAVLPETLATFVSEELWSARGWSTFEAMFNPVWIAGLTLALVALTPLLQPGGPRTPREIATVSAAYAACFLVHPYSAVVVLAVVAGLFLARALSGELAWRDALRVALALAPAALVLAPIALWQRADPVYEETSRAFLGKQAASVGWYPVTLAALGFFALRGAGRLLERRHPWRHALLGWIGAIAILHASNLVNGYHYVFALHLAVAIVAAPAVADWFGRTGAGASGAAARAAVLVLLFASPLAVTLSDARERWNVDAGSLRLAEALAALPPGNVLAPAELGNLVPAYGPHRVFVGHWFMTPNEPERAAYVQALLGSAERAPELRQLVAREQIDYLVAPAWMGAPLQAAGVPIRGSAPFGLFAIFTIAR